MNIFKILGTIAVNNSEANSSIDETADKAKSAASTLGDKFTTAGNTISGIGKKLAPVSAGVAAVGTSLIALATKTASTTDNIDKMSQKLGISRTAYQEWDYILSQNGASIDSLKMGMKTLNGVIDSASQSGDTAGTAFERLGISYDDLKGKTQEEIFEMTITALQNCTDETERTALANDLLGRSGQEMAPLLNSGAEATEALRQKAHDLGLVLEDETVNAGVNMTDAMDTMKRSLASAGATIATAVMPYITQFCNYIAENMPGIIEKIQGVLSKFDALSPSMVAVIAAVAKLLAVASPVLVVVGKFISGISGVVTIVGGAISKISGLISGLGKLSGILGAITSPIGIVVSAIAALVAIFVTAYNTNETFRNAVNAAWSAIRTTVTGAINAIKTTISTGLNAAKSTVTSVLNAIKSAFSNIMNGAANVVSGAINKIKGFFNFSWSLPAIKLPHFGITGSFSLNPPSIPEFTIEWRKDGGIMTKPTIFDVNPTTGKVQAGGEAGDEAIAPLYKLEEYYKRWSGEGNREMLEALRDLKNTMRTCCDITIKALEKSNSSIVLDNREVGRMVRKYLNN